MLRTGSPLVCWGPGALETLPVSFSRLAPHVLPFLWVGQAPVSPLVLRPHAAFAVMPSLHHVAPAEAIAGPRSADPQSPAPPGSLTATTAPPGSTALLLLLC